MKTGGEKPNQFRPKPHGTEVILRDLLPNFTAQHHWNRGLLPIHSLQVTLKVVCTSYRRKKQAREGVIKRNIKILEILHY